jgi:hypothetical protein
MRQRHLARRHRTAVGTAVEAATANCLRVRADAGPGSSRRPGRARRQEHTEFHPSEPGPPRHGGRVASASRGGRHEAGRQRIHSGRQGRSRAGQPAGTAVRGAPKRLRPEPASRERFGTGCRPYGSPRRLGSTDWGNPRLCFVCLSVWTNTPHPAGFDDYVRGRYGELRRLAFLLCGDWIAATTPYRPRSSGARSGGVHPRPAAARLRPPGRREHDEHVADPGAACTGRCPTWTTSRPATGTPTPPRRPGRAPAPPPGQRQVVVLRYYENMTEAEIAVALGVSAGTVKSRASRALRRFARSDLRELRPAGLP